MEKWIFYVNAKRSINLCKKLEKLGFKWFQGCYVLSDARYVCVNFKDKSCFIGVRFPSQIKTEDLITKQELFNLIKIDKARYTFD